MLHKRELPSLFCIVQDVSSSVEVMRHEYEHCKVPRTCALEEAQTHGVGVQRNETGLLVEITRRRLEREVLEA